MKIKQILTNRLGAIVLLFSILMMVYGGFRGEIKVVFMKATKICMECIGIG